MQNPHLLVCRWPHIHGLGCSMVGGALLPLDRCSSARGRGTLCCSGASIAAGCAGDALRPSRHGLGLWGTTQPASQHQAPGQCNLTMQEYACTMQGSADHTKLSYESLTGEKPKESLNKATCLWVGCAPLGRGPCTLHRAAEALISRSNPQ